MKTFKKPCKKCGELFQPSGKYTKVCDKCKEKDKKPLAIEYWIDEFIYNLKKKTIVSISDIEAFCEKGLNLVIAIESLRKSRDNWRKKYEELKYET